MLPRDEEAAPTNTEPFEEACSGPSPKGLRVRPRRAISSPPQPPHHILCEELPRLRVPSHPTSRDRRGSISFKGDMIHEFSPIVYDNLFREPPFGTLDAGEFLTVFSSFQARH